ncbi:putative Fe-S cluster assembly protein SufT [Anaeromyxobacter oryzae]|uniref:Fe-S cluster assembly protein SufT n=1 Tax=Anaeromyxobacter oryzae TaxID=2918170 RepID=A0ABN6MU84_9BACT|nr:putative Fe-S cluster assembly protein SufT [Anaeromyxobacter oryzae]BDG04532.1 putative Fe-S cluster assembly protein SufT [Anaeromyxobacter oryzae]
MATAHTPLRTLRDVEALLIPQGERVTLPAGTWLSVQQTLGGQLTAMTDRGALVRVDGKDADALGPELVAEVAKATAERAAAAEGPFDEQKVWDALGTVYDPEIPASIVELGLVYLVASEPMEGGHRVLVHMTLTAPACGIGPVLVEDVRHKVLGVQGVKDVSVELVFEPPWDPSRMSEAAKLQLGMM